MRPNTAYAELVGRVSEARLRSLVETISVPRSFSHELAANQRIAVWLADEFEAMGLEVELQGPYSNVVAMTPGARQRAAVLIGAHYDSVPQSPGADDNGSAVAAMMHAAELLVGHDRTLPFCFVAFNCEEDGLVGSRDFVESYLPTSPLEIVLAHVLEMVGYCDPRPGSQALPPGLPVKVPEAGDFLAVLANTDSRRAASRVLSLARGYFPDFPVLGLKVYFHLERKFPVLLRSDHASFWDRGIPSLMWTDTSEFRNHHYHQSTDTPDTLDYAYLRQVTQLLVVSALDTVLP